MRPIQWFAAIFLYLTNPLFFGLAQAQPAVTGVMNAASFAFTEGETPKIARGGIFSIFGAGMGGASAAVSTSFPLPIELNGATVEVTVTSISRSAILTYVSSTQINAILPSDLPSGTGALTVSYSGQTSAAFEVEVVDHLFGVFTIGSGAVGNAVVTDPLDSNPNTWLNLATRPAQPGEIWDIWGTGLGPIDGSDAQAPPLYDQTDVDVQVKVGGVPAQILFRGRSPCCAGLDQIRFVIPEGVEGCCVTLEILVDGVVANSVGMTVSGDDRICSRDMFSEYFGDSDIEALLRRGKFSYASFNLGRNVAYAGSGAGQMVESASAFLVQTDAIYAGCGVVADQQTAPPAFPIGDCLTSRTDYQIKVNPDFTFSANLKWVWAAFEKDGRLIDEVNYEYDYSSVTTSQPPATLRLVEGIFPVVAPRYLDAGSSMNLTGPGISQVLSKSSVANLAFYSWNRQQSFSGPVPQGTLQPGPYTITAPGGSAVGAFTVNFDGLESVQLENASDLTGPISINQPLRLAWEGGSSSVAKVGVTGTSTRVNTQTTGQFGSTSTATYFSCTVDYAPKSYSVPVSVLQRLVPSDPVPGSLSVGVAAAKEVSVPGVDFSSASWSDSYGYSTTFVGGAAAIQGPNK